MPLVEAPDMRPVRMGELSADLERRDGGVIYVHCRQALRPYPRTILERLRHWAHAAPDRAFLADRSAPSGWHRLTYAEAWEKARAIAEALLERPLSPERPIVILSGNSVSHGLLALGAMMARIPFAPVSPAYSLVSRDYAKLRHIFRLLTPGFVFVEDASQFGPALDAVMADGIELVVCHNAPAGFTATSFASLLATQPGERQQAAFSAIQPDDPAKFLFTSGSTGMPKAVINTHRMIACNQVMIASALAFLEDEPPVLVDWLPWNHTAGGNHNFGIALHNGGTLFVDDGTPTPGGIERTVRNLQEIAPTLYFNVPKGYEMLTERLAVNDRLRETFFSRLKLMQYAGAGLAPHVWSALESLARRATGKRIMMITGYGSTETAPFASTTTWPVERPGEVGLPAPGLAFKLVPQGGKLELRLKGPSVTPGYWRDPEKTAEAFDEEGFYRIGDALKFVDPEDVNKGFLFDGRVSEDFKLSTGTWVNVAAVRGALLRSLAPYVRDAVLTGLDRSFIGALLFIDVAAARRLAPDLASDATEAELSRHPALLRELQSRLDTLAQQSTGSSNLVARAVVLDAPPSIDRSEITDKGSINQGAVIAARAKDVEDLYRDPPPAHVLVARRRASAA
jgi:feruloyl-CoA synthase